MVIRKVRNVPSKCASCEAHFKLSPMKSTFRHTSARKPIFPRVTGAERSSQRKAGARVLIRHRYLHPGKGRLLAVSKVGLVGGHLTDLKIWRIPRSGMSQLLRFNLKGLKLTKESFTMSCKAIFKILL